MKQIYQPYTLSTLVAHQEDKQSTGKACFLLLDIGNCRGKVIRYGYDQKQNRCVPFAWSGCGGNLNRFKTKHNCELACRV
ncbi:Kunitz/Bovine pancreatic trypsin inhibitor domain protein [Ancylostoma caninum]|uniref:Kunitz/Bovine pancreatic trypsin inhibitor domain protein n=1 Tax=Ancylostoma caninum TaxID=29170 RepID=A0A368G9M0_ANCCA|nr:Kunitz/Bovine pancreatic trypsin inhibitor domain protein [Ancylostoma caninum]